MIPGFFFTIGTGLVLTGGAILIGLLASGIIRGTRSLMYRKRAGSIEVSSGDVNINRTKGEDLKLTSSSGHIDLANAEYEKLNVEVSSGDIKIGNRKLDGDYMTDDDKSKSIKAETSSGSVTISFK